MAKKEVLTKINEQFNRNNKYNDDFNRSFASAHQAIKRIMTKAGQWEDNKQLFDKKYLMEALKGLGENPTEADKVIWGKVEDFRAMQAQATVLKSELKYIVRTNNEATKSANLNIVKLFYDVQKNGDDITLLNGQKAKKWQDPTTLINWSIVDGHLRFTDAIDNANKPIKTESNGYSGFEEAEYYSGTGQDAFFVGYDLNPNVAPVAYV